VNRRHISADGDCLGFTVVVMKTGQLREWNWIERRNTKIVELLGLDQVSLVIQMVWKCWTKGRCRLGETLYDNGRLIEQDGTVFEGRFGGIVTRMIWRVWACPEPVCISWL